MGVGYVDQATCPISVDVNLYVQWDRGATLALIGSQVAAPEGPLSTAVATPRLSATPLSGKLRIRRPSPRHCSTDRVDHDCGLEIDGSLHRYESHGSLWHQKIIWQFTRTGALDSRLGDHHGGPERDAVRLPVVECDSTRPLYLSHGFSDTANDRTLQEASRAPDVPTTLARSHFAQLLLIFVKRNLFATFKTDSRPICARLSTYSQRRYQDFFKYCARSKVQVCCEFSA